MKNGIDSIFTFSPHSLVLITSPLNIREHLEKMIGRQKKKNDSSSSVKQLSISYIEYPRNTLQNHFWESVTQIFFFFFSL